MKIIIDGTLINTDLIHFARHKSETELLISFGTDFVNFKGSSKKIDNIIKKLQEANEEFSCTD